MRKLLLALLYFSTFLSTAPNVMAHRMPEKSSAPLFWLKAPDDRPGAFFSRQPWKAEVQLSRFAVRAQEVKSAPQTRPAGWENLFAPCAFHGQEPDGNDPFNLPQGELFNDEARTRQGPTVIASKAGGLTLFVVGVSGWVALGICVLLLERRSTPT